MQIEFSFPAEIIPQGNGEVIVRPGKVAVNRKLTPSEFAKEMDVSLPTVYRWKNEGIIPERYIECNGPRKLKIFEAAKDHIRSEYKKRRLG